MSIEIRSIRTSQIFDLPAPVEGHEFGVFTGHVWFLNDEVAIRMTTNHRLSIQTECRAER